MLGQAISQGFEVLVIGIAACSTLYAAATVGGPKLADLVTRWELRKQARREDRELVEMIDDWPAPPPFREEPVDLEGAIAATGGCFVPRDRGRVA
jgi:hypothetical protein